MPKTCLQCTGPVTTKDPRTKFCSRSCSAIYNNTHLPPRRQKKRNFCLVCSTEIGRTSTHCRSHSRDPLGPKERIALWLAGDITVTWVTGSKEPRRWVKQYLIEIRGDRCEECGWDEKNIRGESIIQMDHIDGDYTNNALSNLKLLCPNHHALTETYGSRNLGRGRGHRRSGSA